MEENAENYVKRCSEMFYRVIKYLGYRFVQRNVETVTTRNRSPFFRQVVLCHMVTTKLNVKKLVITPSHKKGIQTIDKPKKKEKVLQVNTVDR